MNSEEFMRVVSIAMSDQTVLPVHLTFADAWILVSALQLATRHPDIHEPLRDRLTDIAKTFIQRQPSFSIWGGTRPTMAWRTRK